VLDAVADPVAMPLASSFEAIYEPIFTVHPYILELGIKAAARYRFVILIVDDDIVALWKNDCAAVTWLNVNVTFEKIAALVAPLPAVR